MIDYREGSVWFENGKVINRKVIEVKHVCAKCGADWPKEAGICACGNRPWSWILEHSPRSQP